MSTQPLTTNDIQMANRLAIPGLSFRRFRGEVDYPQMAQVMEESKRADRIEASETVEDIARRFQYLNNCDPYQDMVFAEVDGQVIGFNQVEWFEESSGQRIYFHDGFLRPSWRHRGIGQAMMTCAERRLRQIAAGHPGNGNKVLETVVYDSQPDLTALLEQEGYQPVRYFYWMVRENLQDIPEVALPTGLEVRLVRPDQYRQVWDANQEAFQDHWGYAPETENDYQHWLNWPYFDPSLWQVAWAGGEVAGMVLSFIDSHENEMFHRQRGWTENICVRRPWRRQGLARALLTRSLYLLKERGMAEAALGVDTQNYSGALRLYESVGFRPSKRLAAYQKPIQENHHGPNDS